VASPRERLLLVTDRRLARDVLAVVDAALAAVPPGTALVQVREKDLTGRALVELSRAVVAAARRRGARVVVNDRADVALASGADGVHLPEGGMEVEDARRILGASSLVGASVHDPDGAAARAGADYLVAGPIWETPGKRAIGVAGLEAILARAGAPVFAIGGVEVARADEALAAGAHGVAVIRAVMAAADPAAAAAALVEVALNR
jgi:thiamine-phosphate pyrophosphorylase